MCGQRILRFKITSGGITNINVAGINPPSPPIIHGASYNQSGGVVTGPALMYFYGNDLD